MSKSSQFWWLRFSHLHRGTPIPSTRAEKTNKMSVLVDKHDNHMDVLIYIYILGFLRLFWDPHAHGYIFLSPIRLTHLCPVRFRCLLATLFGLHHSFWLLNDYIKIICIEMCDFAKQTGTLWSTFTENYGKSLCLMGKLTISWPFSIANWWITRGSMPFWGSNPAPQLSNAKDGVKLYPVCSHQNRWLLWMFIPP